MKQAIALSLLVLCWCSGIAWGKEPLEPTLLFDSQSHYWIGDRVSFLEDATNQLSITTISKSPHLPWRPHPHKIPNFGYSDATIWVKFSIRNPSNVINHPILEIAYPALDYVDLYIFANNKELYHYPTGDMRNSALKLINHRHFVFPLNLKPKTTYTYYLKIKSSGALNLPLKLWQGKDFYRQDQSTYGIQMIYIGVMLVMILYNFFLYCSLRDKNILRYILMSSSVLIAQLYLAGLFGQFISVFSPILNNIIGHGIIHLLIITSALFTLSFLNLRNSLPKAAFVLKLYAGVATLLLVVRAVPTWETLNVHTSQVMSLLVPASFLTYLIIGIITWVRGESYAKYYIIAFGFLCFACITVALTYRGFLPAMPMTENLLMTGSMLEVVLISLALASRTRLDRRQRFLAEQRAARHQLAQTRAEIENQAKTDLLATLSHEIRNPVHGLLGLCDSMLADPINTPLKKQLANMHSTCAYLISLLENMLSQSRLEAMPTTQVKADFNPRSIAQLCIQLFQHAAEQKNIDLTLHIDPRLRDTVRGNANTFQQTLTNLMSNAIKFTPKGTVTTTISTSGSDSTPSISAQVEDTGPGLSSSEQAQLFKRFTQIKNPNHQHHQGIGLGLSICHRLLKNEGGSISCVSKPGQGAAFKFTLPVEFINDTNGTENTAINTDSNNNQPDNPLTLLLAEDVTIILEATSRQLEARGHSVYRAQNGLEAVDRLTSLYKQGKPVDAIILDLEMPLLNGREAAEEIQTIGNGYYRGTPMIAVTASGETANTEVLNRAGFCQVLNKPMPYSRLESAIETLCTSHNKSARIKYDFIDFEILDSHKAHLDTGQFQALVSELKKSCQTYGTSLIASSRDNNFDDMTHQLHALSGTAATFGLTKLAKESQQLESHVKMKDEQNSHRTMFTNHFEKLQLTINESFAEIDAWLT